MSPPNGAAGVVAQHERFALGRGEESLCPSQVEELGLPAEDRGDDLGVAGQSSGFGCGDGIAGEVVARHHLR